MATWGEFERSEPEFAARVRGLFDAHRHKTIATLRADGSPRISGIECAFMGGELTFGSMVNSRKGVDLVRDPRFALHGATIDPVEGRAAEWPGEAKVAGRALLVAPARTAAEGDGPGGSNGSADAGDSGGGGDSFMADITEVVHTHLNEAATLLVIEWWTPAGGMQRVERD